MYIMARNPFPDCRHLAVPVFTLVLTACGGGGGSGNVSGTAPPPAGGNGPTWTQGVFQPEGNFKDRCAVPRTGTNPATGNPYPDIAGSILHENHWLRSWSDNTYLWYNEIIDRNPAPYTNTPDYFEILKTTATTPSGNARDRFHFTRSTAEYQQRVLSGTSAGYGVRWQLISPRIPREVRVAYTEPDSPAASAPANLARGAEVLEIDGVDMINGEDTNTLDAGLFPGGPGETHTFTVRDPGGARRTFSLTSATVTSAPVHTAKTIPVGVETVGYMLFNTFGTSISEQALFDAITGFVDAGVTELVLDMRYNGGGFLDIAAALGFMIAGPANTDGKTFEKLVFNTKHPAVNPVTGNPITPTPFHSRGRGFSVPAGTRLPTLDLNRVFVLSTSRTCSASEALINGLRGVDVEVILIGTQTCGKPYGFYATDNCGTTYFTIQFSAENDKGFGDYADGFTPMAAAFPEGELIPGCETGDDITSPLGNENEAQFAAALEYIRTGACPVPAPRSSKANFAKANDPYDDTSLLNTDDARFRVFLEESRILEAPDP